MILLRRNDANPCHQLHYLQMVTEKLGKAYYWRTGEPPKKSHASFVKFLQALNDRPKLDRSKIARHLGFRKPSTFEGWISSITGLAYDLERLAPALAGDNGPNPEYPWPGIQPINAPASFEFDVWKRLTSSGNGRQLLQVIDAAVLNFPNYG